MLDFAVVDDDPEQRPLPDLRASDADRERAATVLGRAASDGRLDVEELEERLQLAYAARTHGELERLLADVGTDVDVPPGPRVVGQPAPGAGDGTSWVVSVMGGNDRTGRWRIGRRCTVVNVMGGGEIDLNDAELSDPVTQLNVYTLMGGFEIRVPHGVDVRVSKFALMGGHEVDLGPEAPPPGAPVIRIRLLTMMGGGEVRRGRKPGRRGRIKDRVRELGG
ncbi:MAG: hypothetical protein QOI64_718 [Solirubrobacteraceae bacterium]|nr:hypothetical protein [Solirubrobacteraceae bacterium]